jgi:hypothetical protein
MSITVTTGKTSVTIKLDFALILSAITLMGALPLM